MSRQPKDRIGIGPGRAVWTALAWLAALWPAPEAETAEPAWEEGAGYRRRPLVVTAPGRTGFTALPFERTGVGFTNNLPRARYLENLNLLNGSGVALGDYDGDGRCDIFLSGLDRPSALYRNLGDLRFADVAVATDAACAGQASTGATFADVDGDGRLDLLVNSMGGPNALLLNTGGGAWTNVTAAAGLVSDLGGTSLALADVDGNGTLDLYVARYGVNSVLRSGGSVSFRYVGGRPVPAGRYAKRIRIIGETIFELGEPDALFLNDGRGRFTPVSWTEGGFLDEEGEPWAEAPWDQSLSALLRDLDGDGAPDLYVCGDASTPDRLWLNDGRGRFRAMPWLAWRQAPYFSMSVAVADIDRDGHDDFFVTDMLSRQHVYALTQQGTMHEQPRPPGDATTRLQARRNFLQRARGDGTYEDVAYYADVAGSEWTWSCAFLDVDLDGWEDLLVCNGFLHNVDDLDVRDQIQRMGRLSLAQSRQSTLLFPTLLTANLAFHNRGDLTFQEVGQAWGFDSTRISNGMALGDLDGDGDLDVVINCFADGALVYRNDAAAPRLAVRLRGRAPNTQGIGARIRVAGGPVTQVQEVLAGGRYMSGDEALCVFATGRAGRLTLEVRWRNGRRSILDDVLPNYLYEIDETEGPSLAPAPGSVAPQPLFVDVSGRLGHRHVQPVGDDFAVQPLLPYRLSQLGPGVAWFDLDGDGLEELILGSEADSALAVYRYDAGQARFHPIPAPHLPAHRAAAGLAGWVPAPGQRSVLAGLRAGDGGRTDASSLLAYALCNGQLEAAGKPSEGPAQTGPVAVTDLDGDGALDVFVGGRLKPGRYPEPARSGLFMNRAGELELDPQAVTAFERAGLVSGATWADVNGDGRDDLILACEWGPVRLFLNRNGRLTEATADWGLAGHTGLWSGVAVGDFDEDGRLDLVVGNWGLNSPYRASATHPLRLFYGDFDENGTVDLIEAYDHAELGTVPYRAFDAVAAALPAVRGRFGSRREYALASVDRILGETFVQATELKVTTLASTVFLNRGRRFESVSLPSPAQFAPVYGVSVADFNGDGRQDLFLSQNLFATHLEFPRLDAGRGLVLIGNGQGGFRALAPAEVGLAIPGEQRGCAVGDFDGDGRADLVVAQNGAETRVYRNVGGRPGLRVRLIGAPGNPWGVGAVLRPVWGERLGPARPIQAGSGYWSQDSSVTIVGGDERPKAVWVRWPGGQERTYPLPPSAREVRLTQAGEVQADG
ncbi:MAG: hypothetical protein FJ387_01675 [Verrucomicrobia bacterium]|nr:hypothetical protein [Verrucomicrobiota bacterium]